MKNHQRGGFVLGIIVGVLVGLVAALGVALYIAKVPVPFINKVPQRTAEQDQAETDRNRNWDPNAPLAGKGGVRPATTAPAATTAPSAPTGVALVPPAPTPLPRAPRDPGAILAGQSVPGGAAEAAVPIPKSTAAASNTLFYFVQAGAYVREEDAEAQRARLALMDVRAKVTEREQSGRTMFRVRIGPFENKEGAEVLRDKLLAGGVDAALVHVQR